MKIKSWGEGVKEIVDLFKSKEQKNAEEEAAVEAEKAARKERAKVEVAKVKAKAEEKEAAREKVARNLGRAFKKKNAAKKDKMANIVDEAKQKALTEDLEKFNQKLVDENGKIKDLVLEYAGNNKIIKKSILTKFLENKNNTEYDFATKKVITSKMTSEQTAAMDALKNLQEKDRDLFNKYMNNLVRQGGGPKNFKRTRRERFYSDLKKLGGDLVSVGTGVGSALGNAAMLAAKGAKNPSRFVSGAVLGAETIAEKAAIQTISLARLAMMETILLSKLAVWDFAAKASLGIPAMALATGAEGTYWGVKKLMFKPGRAFVRGVEDAGISAARTTSRVTGYMRRGMMVAGLRLKESHVKNALTLLIRDEEKAKEIILLRKEAFNILKKEAQLYTMPLNEENSLTKTDTKNKAEREVLNAEKVKLKEKFKKAFTGIVEDNQIGAFMENFDPTNSTKNEKALSNLIDALGFEEGKNDTEITNITNALLSKNEETDIFKKLKTSLQQNANANQINITNQSDRKITRDNIENTIDSKYEFGKIFNDAVRIVDIGLQITKGLKYTTGSMSNSAKAWAERFENSKDDVKGRLALIKGLAYTNNQEERLFGECLKEVINENAEKYKQEKIDDISKIPMSNIEDWMIVEAKKKIVAKGDLNEKAAKTLAEWETGLAKTISSAPGVVANLVTFGRIGGLEKETLESIETLKTIHEHYTKNPIHPNNSRAM